MRLGLIGNLGLGNQNFMEESNGQASGIQVKKPGIESRQLAGGGGLNKGGIAGNSGSGRLGWRLADNMTFILRHGSCIQDSLYV